VGGQVFSRWWPSEIHVQAAIQWQKISGGDWAAYAADISRRGHAQERAPARDQHADPLPGA
jgi:hypothetical protein